MEIEVSSYFKRRYQKLSKKNRHLASILDKTVKLLADNPNHSSLWLHKLSGKHKNLWSISVTKGLRVTLIYRKGGILMIDIGSHDEVYKSS